MMCAKLTGVVGHSRWEDEFSKLRLGEGSIPDQWADSFVAQVCGPLLYHVSFHSGKGGGRLGRDWICLVVIVIVVFVAVVVVVTLLNHLSGRHSHSW
jgi:hypothetical protein